MPKRPADPEFRLNVLFGAFAVSIVAFLIEPVVASRAPALGMALAVIGLVPCGLAWLFARALFRKPASSVGWPEGVVLALFLVCLALYLGPSNRSGGVPGYLAECQALLSSSVLLLTLIEALDKRGTSGRERTFRLSFAGGYAAIVAVSFVFLLPEFDHATRSAQSALAFTALLGATAAWAYRRKHALVAATSTTSRPALAAAITAALRDDALYLNPELKVAALAEHLGEADYKVSRCIVQDLGYRNFNQLVNAYRVEEARRRLASDVHAQDTILAVAMQCGFGSVGVFNRQFKNATGMTPSAFRRGA